MNLGSKQVQHMPHAQNTAEEELGSFVSRYEGMVDMSKQWLDGAFSQIGLR